MRIDVKKYLFLGLQEDRLSFFEAMQKLGAVYFINPEGFKEGDYPPDIQRLIQAIKVLRGLPTVDQEEIVNFKLTDERVNQILHYRHLLDKLEEEQRVLKLEMARVSIFGNFHLDDVAYIEKKTGRQLQFFCCRKGKKAPDDFIFIGSEDGLDYYTALSPDIGAPEGMIEMKIDRPIGELKKRKDAVDLEWHRNEDILKEYAKWNVMLHKGLTHKLNRSHLHAAEDKVQKPLEGALFAIEGWVPDNQIGEVRAAAKEKGIMVDETAVLPDEAVPTYLENQGFSRMGQDLVGIYDTPSTTDLDPSPWVLWAFAIFFAFIIGDAGYGSVYLGLALFLRYKYPEIQGVAKRVLNLFTILCVAIIIWGLLTTSIFGLQIPPDSVLRKFSLVQWLAEKKVAYLIEHQDKTYQNLVAANPALKEIKDPAAFLAAGPLNSIVDGIMMELSLLFGVLHVSIGMIRYMRRNWAMAGWLLFIWGGYLYFPTYLGVPSFLNVFGISLERAGKEGLLLLQISIPLAVFLAVLKNKWLGLLEIMNSIQVFADILSYLRLYALGLAGAIVAATINEMAAKMPVVIAFVVILMAHGINMILGIMSGVIHGLRLNFLEWYHYSFEGGGKAFKPLRLFGWD